MSDLKKYLILYSSENQAVAEQLSDEFQSNGQECMILEKGDHDLTAQLGQIAVPPDSQIVLLITDNFLKSYGCMNGVLHAAHKWGDENRLIALVTSGMQTLEDGSKRTVSTNFERVGEIIQYMNYWQDKYLALRKEKRNKDDDEELDEEIAVTKEISAETGEFLRYIRGLGYYSLEEFSNKFIQNQNRQQKSEELPDGAAILDMSPAQPKSGPAKSNERSLVEMIEDSSEELMAENSDLTDHFDTEEEALSEESLSHIPGLDLLNELDQEEESEEQVLIDELLAEQPSTPESGTSPDSGFSKNEIQRLDEENDELMAILDEVLQDEGLSSDSDKEEFKFLGDDPDNPGDFDIDSLFGDEDKTFDSDSETGEEEEDNIPVDENEVLLNLIESEDGEISTEEILEESVEYFRENQIEEGISHLAAAIQMRPHDTSLRYYHSYALARYTSDFEGAKAGLEALLKMDKDHPDGWFLLAELAENQQDFEGARKSFERVLKGTPDFPDTHYRLGLLIAEHFNGEEAIAVDHLKKAVQQDEQNVDALYMLASLLNENLDQPENSVKYFRKALNQQPDHPFANYDLALVYHSLNDVARAREYYLRAISINPELKTPQNDIAFNIQQEIGDRIAQMAGVQTTEQSNLHQSNQFSGSTLKEYSVAEEEGDEEHNGGNGFEDKDQQYSAVAQHAMAHKSTPLVETKVVLITGATSGIGKATAEVFAKNGYRVMMTGRRENLLLEISEELSKKYNCLIHTLTFDVRDQVAMQAAVNKIPDDWKNIDILVNNAGLSRGLHPIHEGNLDDWETMIDTNIKGLLYMTRAISPYMVERKNGHIINVSSIAGTEVYPGGNVYSASKAAVSSLTRSMRLDLHKHNVRVSQVSPGHVEETEFAKVRFDGDMEKAAKVYENFQPLRSSDVAETIFFIASRPPHVNIQDVYMYGTQQASATMIERSGR